MDRDHPVDIICDHCKRLYVFHVNKEDLDKFFAREKPIEDLLPYLDAGERELLLSRTCGDCFDELFGLGDVTNED